MSTVEAKKNFFSAVSYQIRGWFGLDVSGCTRSYNGRGASAFITGGQTINNEIWWI